MRIPVVILALFGILSLIDSAKAAPRCPPPHSDPDNDCVKNGRDNCPFTYNPDQENRDGDRDGDACDADLDGDNILDRTDNCPWAQNPDQEDIDLDGAGDACDVQYNPNIETNDWSRDEEISAERYCRPQDGVVVISGGNPIDLHPGDTNVRAYSITIIACTDAREWGPDLWIEPATGGFNSQLFVQNPQRTPRFNNFRLIEEGFGVRTEQPFIPSAEPRGYVFLQWGYIFETYRPLSRGMIIRYTVEISLTNDPITSPETILLRLDTAGVGRPGGGLSIRCINNWQRLRLVP